MLPFGNLCSTPPSAVRVTAVPLGNSWTHSRGHAPIGVRTRDVGIDADARVNVKARGRGDIVAGGRAPRLKLDPVPEKIGSPGAASYGFFAVRIPMKKAGLDDGRKRKRGREGQNGGADVQEDADAAAGGAAGGAVDGAAPAIARQAKPRGRPKGKQTFATQPLQGSAEQQRRMTHASVSLSTSVLHTNAQIGDKGKFVLAFLPTGGKVRGAMSARFVSNAR